MEADEDSAEPSPRRLAALRAVDGIIDVRRDTETRVVVAARPRVEVVGRPSRRLPVIGVSSRRHLEEVFLGVISSASASGNGLSTP